jgi:hypothetical protein
MMLMMPDWDVEQPFAEFTLGVVRLRTEYGFS